MEWQPKLVDQIPGTCPTVESRSEAAFHASTGCSSIETQTVNIRRADARCDDVANLCSSTHTYIHAVKTVNCYDSKRSSSVTYSQSIDVKRSSHLHYMRTEFMAFSNSHFTYYYIRARHYILQMLPAVPRHNCYTKNRPHMGHAISTSSSTFIYSTCIPSGYWHQRPSVKGLTPTPSGVQG